MAAALVEINCLANSKDNGDRAWKRKLFYILGYCDTVHDFQAPRGAKKEEGASLDAKDIPNRRTFILNAIKQMDPDLGYPGYYDVIDAFRLRYKYGTFENTVFAIFSQLQNNPLIEALPEDIQENVTQFLHDVYQVPAGEANQFEVVDKTFFDTANPESSSSIIEFSCPAVPYSPAWQTNFITFLKNIYPTTVRTADGKLQFVEDAASFPRELLITTASNFQKRVTLQTKWDPAGNSSFKPGSVEGNDKVYPAPSFRALKASNVDPSKNTIGDEGVEASFSEVSSELKYPGSTLKIDNKPGPSVNHLFLHIARHAAGVDPKVKQKAEALIKRAKVDSKKNMTLNLKADKGNAANDAKYLREFTSSKRSGDYENIHSAMANNCILFTGDEPAFTYAVLNKQPVILHYLSGPEHVFRFYVPPPATPAELQRRKEEKVANALVLKAGELIKIFGASDGFFKGYLTNIQASLTGDITVGQQKDTLAGLLLKATLYSTMLELDGVLFGELNKANAAFKEAATLSASIPDIQRQIDEIERKGDKAVKKFASQLEKLSQDKQSAVADLDTRTISLDTQLGEILLYLPRVFQKNAGGMKVTDSQLCVETGSAMTAVFQKAGPKYYTFRSTGILPQFKQLTNFTAIAKTIRSIRAADQPSQTASRRLWIQQIKDTLVELNCPASVTGLFAGANLPTDAAVKGVVSELEKRFNEMVTKYIPAPGARRGGRRRNVNGSRKQNKNSKNKNTDPVQPTTGPTDYAKIHAELMSLDPAKIPFGLDPQVYADAIVERLTILDTLHAKIQEDSLTEGRSIELLDGIEETHYEVLDAPDAPQMGPPSKPTFNKVQPEGLPSLNEDPIALVQSGGAYSEEFRVFLVNLYYDVVEPFLRKHYWDIEGTIYQSTLASVIGGSFLQDTLALLEELMNLPTGLDLSSGDAAQIDSIRTNAATAHASIFSNILQLKDATKVFTVNERVGAELGAGIAEFVEFFRERAIFTNVDNYELLERGATFLEKLLSLPAYLQATISITDLPEGEALKQEEFNKAIDAAGKVNADWITANKELLELNVRYAVVDQFAFEYGDDFVPVAPAPGGGAGAAAAAPGANEGGRRQTRKKGRRQARKQTKRQRR